MEQKGHVLVDNRGDMCIKDVFLGTFVSPVSSNKKAFLKRLAVFGH